MPVLAFGYCLRLCVCPCVCVNPQLVHAITHHPSKLGSPNFDHRCKKTLVKIPIVFFFFFFFFFWGGGDWPWPSRSNFNFKAKIYPHFELVRVITHHLFKLESPNVGQRCKIPWLRSLWFLRLIGLDRSNLTLFKNPIYLHRFCVFEIFVGHAKAESDALFHIPHGSTHMPIPLCKPKGRFMDSEPV